MTLRTKTLSTAVFVIATGLIATATSAQSGPIVTSVSTFATGGLVGGSAPDSITDGIP